MNLDTMRLLVAKGLSAADILEVAEAMAVRSDPTAAERQARHRAKVKAERDTVARDVTRDSNDTPALSPSPNENNSNPHPHTHPDIKTPRARKGHRLPDDWHPAPLTGDTAADIATWPPGALERELARFRDWAASANGPNALKTDWQAAWRNWLRKAHDEGRNKPQNDRSRPSHDRPTTREIGERVAARLAAGSGGNPHRLPELGPPGRYVRDGGR